jgi:uncharacterized circularly permuted ATP-grasp superfamily protein/uncharacterized alpha-E superfamily protein
VSDGLTSGYQAPTESYDEMMQPDGTPRAGWRSVLASPDYETMDGLGQRWRDAERQIRENGVTYNVYGDPRGLARPWPLDPLPHIIGAEDWRGLEAGLVQRARLLEAVMGDLYGPQSLLHGGTVPPGAVFGNPGFLRPCHGAAAPGGSHLHLIGIDLGREPDGSWIVLGDRTQAPSGTGYALENRMVMASVLSDTFSAQPVERLSGFFRALRDNLTRAAAIAARRSRGSGAEPRVVLLTPGPYNETYFEHAYLARYLGFPLVAGEDLTVRYDRVYLKTLGGLQPVDGILRRLDDGYCDPLWLAPGSTLGVAGLVLAARHGNVAICNSLGSGILEAPSLFAHLPAASRSLLAEDLLLPQVETLWPVPAELPADMMPKPAFGGEPAPRAPAERSRPSPFDQAATRRVQLSTAPVWRGGRLDARPVVLRAYVAASDEDWVVMPGGLARFGANPGDPVVSMQVGGGSKDIWVVADKPVEAVSLWPETTEAVSLRRTATADLPSRVADNLFWLGRYAERAEVMLRLVRATLGRYLPDASAGVAAIPGLLRCLGAFGIEPPLPPIPTALMVTIDAGAPGVLTALHRSATMVRDRLSADAWRILNPFGHPPKLAGRTVAAAASEIEFLLTRIAGFNGLAMENMTRGLGWRFLELGRRIERAYQTMAISRILAGIASPDEAAALEALLEVCDSSMTYRSRYFTDFKTAPALDLVVADDTNPRAIAFQLAAINEHLRHLPRERTGGSLTTIEHRMAAACLAELRRADMAKLAMPEGGQRPELNRFTQTLTRDLSALSDALGETYFKHAVPALLDHGPTALTARR